MLRALDVKVLRDIRRTGGQVVAIVFVIACGVGVYLGMTATMHSLQSAKTSFYAEQRFGHVFAHLKRAPEHVQFALRAIPGVQSVETRVVADVTLDIDGMVEATSGRVISIPERGRPTVNDVRLRYGRLPVAERGHEVLASEAFMAAHGFSVGARIGAVLNGSRVELRVVGVALSPEYTISVGPGLPFPDDRRFGVFWMRRDALAAAFDMEGAFNDVSLRLSRDADARDVIARVDRVLARFGGLGAFERRDQQSAFFVESELLQLESFAFFVPALFLGVAAFLLNIVFGRLVASQRSDIAALKAFGYRDHEVGLHYAKLAGIVLFAGWLLGLALAIWMGSALVDLYGRYYRFPDMAFRMGLREPLEGLAISALGAGLGAWTAIRKTIVLSPAEAMRPAAPPNYRPTLVERLGLSRVLPTALRIILREMERKPLRSALSATGIAMATALIVSMAFTGNSVDHMLIAQYQLGQRDDLQLTLHEPRAIGAVSELEHLPGVLHAEPFRNVGIELQFAHRSKRTVLSGLPADSTLVGLLDTNAESVAVPADGLVLSDKLARLLHVGVGDTLRVKILEGRRHVRDVTIARIVETFVGTAAYMNLDALCRMLGETPSLNGARLSVDDRSLPQLHAAVKRTPLVTGAVSRDTVLHRVRRMMAENIGVMTFFSLLFSLVMAYGVLHNTVRITLAERARELATLRVLGFRRAEVATILFGEMAIVIGCALPVGLLVGYGLSAALVQSPAYDTEQFRLPLVIYPSTYATAVLAVLGAGLVSGWSAWKTLDNFDIVEVLKTRD